MKIFPLCYFPSISWINRTVEEKSIVVDIDENFIKQTFRNRCVIAGPNGKMNLSIPLEKYPDHTPYRNIKISYRENWQKSHWRSIESAYRRSAYFEYYEHFFSPFFNSQSHEFLYEFNFQILKTLFKISELDIQVKFSETYEKQQPDYRTILAPKGGDKGIITGGEKTYTQVFENKYPFIPGLSVIDLLFNTGEVTQ